MFAHDESEATMADKHAGHDTAEGQLRSLRPSHSEPRHLGDDGEPGGPADANAMYPQHQQGHAKIVGPFQKLPPAFARERSERGGEKPPTSHIQEPCPYRRHQR